MGVVFCGLFLWWFATGIVMMYWGYPRVTAGDRLGRAEPIDASRVRITANEAYERLNITDAPIRATLTMFDGRPVYRFRGGSSDLAVYADNGSRPLRFETASLARIAARWAGQSTSSAAIEIVREEDQWTVARSFAPLRPLAKYSWPDGQAVYVSTVTAQVVQHTTRASRWGAYLGAIPHWLYFTPLRRNQDLWRSVVIVLSGAGTLMALLGMLAGLLMYSPRKVYKLEGKPTSVPFSGQRRLHTMLGLFFGVTAGTWAFSGMMSMDPLAISRRPAEPHVERIRDALRGTPQLRAFDVLHPAKAIGRFNRDGIEVKELELACVGGESVYIAHSGSGSQMIAPNGTATRTLPAEQIAKIVAKAVHPFPVADVRVVTEHEPYYVSRREERPLPVVALRLGDSESSVHYVDPASARIVQSYDSTSRAMRWLYHGLHSWDLPVLYKYRPAWDILVLAFMIGGTALSLTGVLIGWRLLRRRRPSGATLNELKESVYVRTNLVVAHVRAALRSRVLRPGCE